MCNAPLEAGHGGEKAASGQILEGGSAVGALETGIMELPSSSRPQLYMDSTCRVLMQPPKVCRKQPCAL